MGGKKEGFTKNGKKDYQRKNGGREEGRRHVVKGKKKGRKAVKANGRNEGRK